MGNEAKCKARVGTQAFEGKALLETQEIIFRGDTRLKIVLSTVQSVKVAGDWLQLQTSEGRIEFELGTETAEKWAKKILHPKSRLEKLGIKDGLKIAVMGKLDGEFAGELRKAQAEVARKIATDTKIIFFAVETKTELGLLPKIAKQLKGAAALWIVYPKGVKAIAESDVLAAGRATGLKDVKVVGFSPTHTALKFVVSIANR